MKYNLVLLLLAFLLTNCATIFLGSKQDIQLNTDPPGAQVYVNGNMTNQTTPCKITIKKNEHVHASKYGNKNEIVYTFMKEGFGEAEYVDKSKVNWLIVLDFYCYGVGGIIDLITKAHRVYEKSVFARLPTQVSETKDEIRLVEAEAEKARAETARILADAEKTRAEAALVEAKRSENTGTSKDRISKWDVAEREGQPQYRGGDPLKGLNVSNANKELVIGKYYALLIGIDKYQGEWAPLRNAVNDAKVVLRKLY